MAGEYKEFRKIKVPIDQVNRVVKEYNMERSPVQEFYKYTWSTDTSVESLYCVSPDVFEDIEIPQP